MMTHDSSCDVIILAIFAIFLITSEKYFCIASYANNKISMFHGQMIVSKSWHFRCSMQFYCDIEDWIHRNYTVAFSYTHTIAAFTSVESSFFLMNTIDALARLFMSMRELFHTNMEKRNEWEVFNKSLLFKIFT